MLGQGLPTPGTQGQAAGTAGAAAGSAAGSAARLGFVGGGEEEGDEDGVVQQGQVALLVQPAGCRKWLSAFKSCLGGCSRCMRTASAACMMQCRRSTTTRGCAPRRRLGRLGGPPRRTCC